jgi:hypothetical protein
MKADFHGLRPSVWRGSICWTLTGGRWRHDPHVT